MNRILISSFAVLFIFIISCKNSDKENTSKGVLGENGGKSLPSTADSLYQKVINEHEKGMSGWMKIKGRQKQIKNLHKAHF